MAKHPAPAQRPAASGCDDVCLEKFWFTFIQNERKYQGRLVPGEFLLLTASAEQLWFLASLSLSHSEFEGPDSGILSS